MKPTRLHHVPRLLAAVFAAVSGRAAVDPKGFETMVKPFVHDYCAKCHNARKLKGDLNLEAFLKEPASHALEDRKTWSEVVRKLSAGEMPPVDEDQPSVDQIGAVIGWLDGQYAVQDRDAKPNPGRVTVRRLNRYEYNNTVRDLLGVSLRFSEDFPADQFGYGFNNIGDVLSLSPVLMEKYLQAAEQIGRAAIPTEKPIPELAVRYEAEATGQQNRLHIQALHDFPVEGIYNLRTAWEQGLPANFKMTVRIFLDGKAVLDLPIEHSTTTDRAREARGVAVTQGTHKVEAEIEVPPPRPGARNTPNPYPVRIEVDGPFQQVSRQQAVSYQRIFQTAGGVAAPPAKSAREILSTLLHRAYRRPVTRKDLNPLLDLVKAVQSRGGSLEDGIRVALQAKLIAPDFLFRVERDPAGNDAHRIGDLELASRLSYFLWSSMPDDELLAVAEQGHLHDPDVLHAQVRRMMADRKARTLAENFGSQWLQTRNLDTLKPDSKLFPDYDLELRDAMLTETTMFFQAVVDEDRSILDFLDGRFTFVNERLARHYGIPDVKGREFRRVELDGKERSGVLTQASVLTVSSYPTRTSPVLRGKWVLENILNRPPPLPPANVPALDEKEIGETASLRERLEQHRANPTCAACHGRMDPLGFGLENYDPIGRWRTVDGKIPLDTSGRLPNNQTFAGAAEMKAMFRSDAPKFTRAFAEKILIYALGRGLEYYDRPAIDAMAKRIALNDGRFSEVILAAVDSVPFQMRHREPVSLAKTDNGKEKPR